MNIQTILNNINLGNGDWKADVLYNPEIGCGCAFDDLAPCESMNGSCCLARGGIAEEDGDIHEAGDQVFFQINTEHSQCCEYYIFLKESDCDCGHFKQPNAKADSASGDLLGGGSNV